VDIARERLRIAGVPTGCIPVPIGDYVRLLDLLESAQPVARGQARMGSYLHGRLAAAVRVLDDDPLVAVTAMPPDDDHIRAIVRDEMMRATKCMRP
jgi:hypothetical protein